MPCKRAMTTKHVFWLLFLWKAEVRQKKCRKSIQISSNSWWKKNFNVDFCCYEHDTTNTFWCFVVLYQKESYRGEYQLQKLPSQIKRKLVRDHNWTVNIKENKNQKEKKKNYIMLIIERKIKWNVNERNGKVTTPPKMGQEKKKKSSLEVGVNGLPEVGKNFQLESVNQSQRPIFRGGFYWSRSWMQGSSYEEWWYDTRSTVMCHGGPHQTDRFEVEESRSKTAQLDSWPSKYLATGSPRHRRDASQTKIQNLYFDLRAEIRFIHSISAKQRSQYFISSYWSLTFT